MKSSNAELVSRIEQASAGLTFWSDNDSPFKTFAWKTSEKGNLTIEKLLKSESFIQLLKIDDFIQFVSLDKNWLNSLRGLQGGLNRLQGKEFRFCGKRRKGLALSTRPL